MDGPLPYVTTFGNITTNQATMQKSKISMQI
jgi:hypothetical protein